MKFYTKYLSALVVLTLLFASCSKEESSLIDEDANFVELTFGASLNDLANRAMNKQSVGDLVPDCATTAPDHAVISFSYGGNDYEVTVDILNDSNGYFTDYSELLKIPVSAGGTTTVTLTGFLVYDSTNTVIWAAPVGSGLANYVDQVLPRSFEVAAGTKPYIDVEVLCFDRRMVNEYGYVFFDIDTNRAIQFCIFGNYCPPSGRHYPASYSVSVWYGTDASGTPLYTEVQNQTGTYDNGDFYAEPLCFALPDTDGTDNYYFEITLLSSDEYGNVEERIIREGTITDDVVRTFFDGDDNIDYYHFQEGCNGDDSPPIFEDPQSEAEYYKTCAYPMNGTNSIALAFFEVQDNILKATVLAAGVTPNQQHMQHIHGKDDNSNATCPPASNNGFITLEQGLPFYGGVQLALNYEDGTYPVADAYGFYTYQRTFDLSGVSLSDWENTTVVVHGRNVNGVYNPSLPVACGQVNNLHSDH
jgi:hypothetical protein